MTDQGRTEQRVGNVLIPTSLLSDARRFGGVRSGDGVVGDLIVQNGIAVRLQPTKAAAPPAMILPRLIEPHVHLDKCHTAPRLSNVGGDLHAAIAEQWRDKQNWTDDDIRARAARGLTELAEAGCGALRSHVDWSHAENAKTPPRAWYVLSELAEDSALAIQLSPLAGVEDYLEPDVARSLAQVVKTQGGALGCFVHGQPHRAAGIAAAFAIAQAHDLPLDFHVDEGLNTDLDGLEIIADAALEIGFERPILCGHACSLMNFEGKALSRVLDKMARAGITVATLPSTNLYLQGRGAGTPDRRGITRIRELQTAGVPVVVGTDNVRDAFCPTGRHDPLSSLSLAVLCAHLDPPLGDHLPMVTTDAARALGLQPHRVDGARIEDLMICEAPTTSDLLAGGARPKPLSTYLQGAPA